MKELKKMIVDSLLDEYPLEEANCVRDVDEAEIVINGNNVRVIWSNGKTNEYTLVITERLVLVS
jgi:hypothetical protein